MAEQETEAGFTNWSLDTWNLLLYRHFFTVLPGTQGFSHLVRLYVTSDELCAAANIRSRHVRSAFINAIQRAIGPRSLGLDAYRRYSSWDKDGPTPPPFLSHLLLTCMIANDLAEDIKSIGDFRARLSLTLGGKSSHSLRLIRKLWEEFAKWSTRRHTEDPHCKQLLLPHIPKSGYHSIIGYSVRLAVPSRRDLNALTLLLHKHKLVGFEPEINAVLELVNQNIGRFSGQFGEVFRDFSSALKKAPAAVLFHKTFWAAVREVVFSQEIEAPQERCKTRLELEDDEGQFWLSITSDSEVDVPQIKSIALPNTRRSLYRFILIMQSEGSGLASRLFSNHKLDMRVEKLLRGVREAVSSGFLLFKESDDDLYALSTEFPSTGDLRALVSERQLLPFGQALEKVGNKLEARKSIHTGWFELRGLTIELLRRLDVSPYPSLLSIRCLKATLPPPEIRFRGGVRLGESFVALRRAMPLVQISDAKSVMVELQSGNWSSLEKHSSIANNWCFCTDMEPQLLLGNHRVVAYVGSLPIAERKVTFVEGTYNYEYKRPVDISRWFVESAECDNISFSEETVAITEPTNLIKVRLKTTVSPAAGAVLSEAEKRTALDLATILSCQLAEKRGISEGSLASLLNLNFGLTLSKIWPILRALVEAGILDVLGDYRWRGRTYFARIPQLVVFRRGSLYEAVLTGLIPPFLLERFNRLSTIYRLIPLDDESCSPTLPSLPRCRSTNLGVLSNLAQELNLPPVVPLRVPSLAGTSIQSVIDQKASEPKNWPAYREWDWNRRIFTDHSTQRAYRDLSLQWCRRDDGPDCYKLYRGDSVVWWTRSRIWAVLAAFTLAALPVFERQSNGVLESWGDSLYLPLPLARMAAVISTKAPGPIESSRDKTSYRYTFPDDQTRDSFLDILWPQKRVHELSPWTRRRLLAISQKGTGPLIPMPLALRQALRQFSEAGPIRTIGLVPSSALPELYAILCSTVDGDGEWRKRS